MGAASGASTTYSEAFVDAVAWCCSAVAAAAILAVYALYGWKVALAGVLFYVVQGVRKYRQATRPRTTASGDSGASS